MPGKGFRAILHFFTRISALPQYWEVTILRFYSLFSTSFPSIENGTVAPSDHFFSTAIQTPKGDLIASVSYGTVKLWNFKQDQLLEHACNWVSDYLKNNADAEERGHLCPKQGGPSE